MTTPAIQTQAALDAVLELVTSHLELALDLVASAGRAQSLSELARLCNELQALSAAAVLVRGQ